MNKLEAAARAAYCECLGRDRSRLLKDLRAGGISAGKLQTIEELHDALWRAFGRRKWERESAAKINDIAMNPDARD